MSVVKVDDRGRLTLSRELKGADKAVVINAGTFRVLGEGYHHYERSRIDHDSFVRTLQLT